MTSAGARHVVLVLVAVLAAACGDDASPAASDAADANAVGDAAATGDAAPAVPMTWHGDARAVIAANCLGCHVDGGVAPFSLEAYEDASAWGPYALQMVDEGVMPPWPPDDDCRPIQNARGLTDEEVAALAGWVASGLPEGDPAEYVAPAVASSPADALGAPDLALVSPDAYTPRTDLTDDYHCFVLDDPALASPTFVRMLDVVPGNGDSVHHVIVFEVDAEHADAARSRDAATPEPGYTCFGGAGVGGSRTIGGWVPGSVPFAYDADTALAVPAGAVLVMQVHYNTLASADPDPGTELRLWLADDTPAFEVAFVALANGSLGIPAGDANARFVKRFDNPVKLPIPVIGVLPHMHLLGEEIRLTAEHTDGSETCVVHIPDWDFKWQQQYYFETPLTFGAQDFLRLECVYDNSAANQPRVDGAQVEPRFVTWGEGTLDEMCLAYAILRVPYIAPGTECSGYQACYKGCRAGGEGMSFCVVSCGLERTSCLQCVGAGLVDCMAPDCTDQVGSLVTCVTDCFTKSANPAACAFLECSDDGAALDACGQDRADAGGCDAAMDACKTSLAYP